MTFYKELGEIEKSGKPVALCTIVKAEGITPRHEGSKMLVFIDGSSTGSIGGGEAEQIVIQGAQRAINERESKLIHYSYGESLLQSTQKPNGTITVFIDPILPKITIVVAGGGHVGRQVVFLAKWLGYHVVLTDERSEFCNSEMVPNADQYIQCQLSSLPEHIAINTNTFLVLTTKNADVDIQALPTLLETKAGYIGVIGSKKRWEATKNGLQKTGISKNKIDTIHSPIGLDLDAETPEEIALSILAEVLLSAKQNNVHPVSS